MEYMGAELTALYLLGSCCASTEYQPRVLDLTFASTGQVDCHRITMADSPVDDQSVSVAQELDTSMEKLKRILTIQALSTRPVVQNYQCASFFATVCCFMPLGIWAFVKLGDVSMVVVDGGVGMVVVDGGVSMVVADGDVSMVVADGGVSMMVVDGGVSMMVVDGGVSMMVVDGGVSMMVVDGGVSMMVVDGGVSMMVVDGGVSMVVVDGGAQEAKERGDTLSAERHTREAKKMVLLSVVMMVVLITICTILSSLILLLVSRKLANAEDALADRTKNHTGV
ncbi:hypothetical protein Btru_021652 [Bulinus truncatus]|nr:hypothetical protein Btru_021652 [Bulinus truncatus]